MISDPLCSKPAINAEGVPIFRRGPLLKSFCSSLWGFDTPIPVSARSKWILFGTQGARCELANVSNVSIFLYFLIIFCSAATTWLADSSTVLQFHLLGEVVHTFFTPSPRNADCYMLPPYPCLYSPQYLPQDLIVE